MKFYSVCISLAVLAFLLTGCNTAREGSEQEKSAMIVTEKYEKPSDDVLRRQLTAEQYAVTQEAATERPFTTQNLLSDAEVTICKYKWLIISAHASNYGGQILCRGTEEGRKIYKNLQMKLPSKIKYTKICKDVFPVLCIFTFVNKDFCTFLYSL